VKRLTFGQAQSCETATGPVCRCRCGGAFHGIARVTNPTELPEDDVHYVHPEDAFYQPSMLDAMESHEGTTK